MRILLCNKFYYRRGGDCIYTLNLEELFRSKGHEVAIFAMDYPENDDSQWTSFFPSEVNLSSVPGKLRFFLRSLGDSETRRQFGAILDDFRPDIVHLNNIHTQLSPVVAQIAHGRGIRVIWTLHDYKLVCPRYDCMRKGADFCELCFKSKFNVMKYSCMKDSFAASMMAFAEAVCWNRSRLVDNTDFFICPSGFMRDKMVQAGFPGDRIVHLCNFIDTEKCQREDYCTREDYYCYVGRLSTEKGVKTLAEVASSLPSYKLIVIGDGPLQGSLPVAGQIEYAGKRDWPYIKEIVGKARFMVMPSECYENNPLSVIESLSLGTPVLGARIGGIPELVDEGKNGLLFNSGDRSDLRRRVTEMFNHSFDYSGIASESQKKFSQESYYNDLMLMYAGGV